MAISQEKRATKSTSLESRWAHSHLFNISIQMFFPRWNEIWRFGSCLIRVRAFFKKPIYSHSPAAPGPCVPPVLKTEREKSTHTQKGTRAPWFGWFSNVEREAGSALEDNGVNFLAGRIKMMKRVSLILSRVFDVLASDEPRRSSAAQGSVE